ncbi:Nucleoside-diphosphate-sugar epimerase [Candidatus Propionivibrio aalborgensis]|uniref:Nucleoside-diphosphate-sugar epimerase n=1 Tax=Candidatus Propionivibrio aalborgensis TaxID=1860101 RepID=A0A1A8XRZ9_9RHOO|nr:NAD-dependent epimerase/dehydratase family protein [Candidatus Propionivibrio aalborgensis]SBT07466.1 Nucleoside-diphosphate-sugar epimerase [Candidatus Propionivibrio aalborgensis]
MNRDGVLLLGGSGFIGRALAERLNAERAVVHIVGRNDGDRLERAIPECGTVIHLASATTPGSSARNPNLELGNLALTLRLLELLQSQPETHLIFFSSGGTVYGNPDRLPVTEDAPIAPLSNHGAGKASQEVFLQAYRARGHAITMVRPSNAYGPGQTLRQGFGLIRTLLEHACCDTPIQIWGDGESVRDFIFIDDIVEATTRLIKLPLDSGTYNLSSGTGYSINQVLGIVEKVCRKPLYTEYRGARGIDVRNVILDNTQLKELLAWAPLVDLEDGVRRTFTWLRQA